MFILNPYTAKPNTIIGGIGSVITTKSALATKLGISESIIQWFKIVGNDVHCKITSNYTLPSMLFRLDATISSYLDIEDKVINLTGSSHFEDSSIKTASINGILTIPNFMANNSQMEVFSATSATSLGNNSLSNTPIHTLNAPNINTLLTSSLQNTPNLINFNPSALLHIGQFAMSGCGATPDPSQIISINNSGMRGMKYAILNLNSFTTHNGTGNRVISDMNLCVNAFINNLGSIPDSLNYFTNWTSAELIEMKKLKTYGTLAAGGGTGVTYGFATLKTGCIIRVNVALATANSGNPHEAFVWAKANRSATVEFYDDAGNYVSTL